MLTKKQYALLLFIDNYLKEMGISPSFDEMRNGLGLKSKSGIHRLIRGLEERQFIRHLPNRARALELVRLPQCQSIAKKNASPFCAIDIKKNVSNTQIIEIPLCGKIAAGVPIEAVNNVGNCVSVPPQMLGVGEHYALTVEGDSMINAGIFDGDTVIIQSTQNAENGALVVALIDGVEVSLKRLRRRGNMIALEAENPRYETRVFSPERVAIQGRLVGLMRNY